VVMTERKMFPSEIARGAVDVMVTILNHETREHALALAAELRRTRLRVDVYPESYKPGKQLKYASSRGVPFVAILGEDERARGEVAIKDLRTGVQTPVPRAEVAAFISQRLSSAPSPEPSALSPQPSDAVGLQPPASSPESENV
jgi:histidyl-tRNA synthetase